MSIQLSRRRFLGSAAVSVAVPRWLAAAKELRCDIAVIGGGTGGCAAALAAARNGARVIMTEETDRIGGQLTSSRTGATAFTRWSGTSASRLPSLQSRACG